MLVPTADTAPFACDFAIAYFAAEAARLRAEVAPPKGDDCDSPLFYALQSFMDSCEPAPDEPSGFELGPSVTTIPLVSRSLADFRAAEAWDEPSSEAMPIFVGRSVVEGAYEEACRHPDREVGGLLLGNVCRDRAEGKVFAEVTCLVSAEGTTESTATTLTFTPDSFQRAAA